MHPLFLCQCARCFGCFRSSARAANTSDRRRAGCAAVRRAASICDFLAVAVAVAVAVDVDVDVPVAVAVAAEEADPLDIPFSVSPYCHNSIFPYSRISRVCTVVQSR
jgi:hypothetical protein